MAEYKPKSPKQQIIFSFILLSITSIFVILFKFSNSKNFNFFYLLIVLFNIFLLSVTIYSFYKLITGLRTGEFMWLGTIYKKRDDGVDFYFELYRNMIIFIVLFLFTILSGYWSIVSLF